MMSAADPNRPVSDDRSASMSRRLSLRWKVLQALGVTLIVLAVCIDWPASYDPGLPSVSSLLVVVGLLVGIAGFVADRPAGS